MIVLPNLYGDIVSDLGAGMIGGLGLAPGANIGTEAAMFEATHGSAPKYKGQNKVNPTALMLSGRADASPPGRGRCRRPDGERDRRGDPRGREGDLRPEAHAATTRLRSAPREFADAVIEEMRADGAPVKVAVTGAAGQIGYALLPRIASGNMLGSDTRSSCGCSRSRTR